VVGDEEAVDLLAEFGGEGEEGGLRLRVGGCGCYGTARGGERWERVERVSGASGWRCWVWVGFILSLAARPSAGKYLADEPHDGCVASRCCEMDVGAHVMLLVLTPRALWLTWLGLTLTKVPTRHP
jgi:hypothetical protein